MKRMAERGGERLTTVRTDGTALAGKERPLEKGAETSIRGSCFGIYQDPQEDNTHRVYGPWRKNKARIWLSCYTYSNDEKECHQPHQRIEFLASELRPSPITRAQNNWIIILSSARECARTCQVFLRVREPNNS